MVLNFDTQKVLVTRLRTANTFWRRLIGLMLQKDLPEDNGLILTPCKSIHTFFMRFPIDVVYLNEYYQVLEIFKDVKPWRVLPYRGKAKYVLEIPVGKIAATGTKKGHRIIINEDLDLLSKR